MQERIGDELPRMKVHLSVVTAQRPERQRTFQPVVGDDLQRKHRHVGGDQAFDGTNVVH